MAIAAGFFIWVREIEKLKTSAENNSIAPAPIELTDRTRTAATDLIVLQRSPPG